jgi:adenylate cyclase
LVAEVPNYQHYTEFNYHYRDKDYAAAAASARATLEIGHWAGPWYLALAYDGMGEDDKAMEALAKARALEPNLTIETVREMMDALFHDQGHVALLMDGHAQLMVLEESQATQRPVIAVLPFDNMSGDPEQEYFADGITEDIITALSRFQEIGVIGRNTTFQYKGQAVDARAIGEDVGASHVLEGSVRRLEGRVRVTAQLLDTMNGTHLWAETFDSDLTTGDIFEIQDQVTSSVASIIGGAHGVIAQRAAEVAMRDETRSLQSYECVLLKIHYEYHTSRKTHSRAFECLMDTVERDPDYADAQAALAYLAAEAYGGFFADPDIPPEQYLEIALGAGRRAARIEPFNAKARWTLAYVEFLSGDVAAFLKNAEKAIELNPNESDVKGGAGTLLAFAGEYERGRQLIEEAIRLNPYHPHWWLFGTTMAHLMSGRTDLALDAILKTADEENHWQYIWRAIVYAELNNIADAEAAIGNLLALRPSYTIAEYRAEAGYWNCTPEFIALGADALRKTTLPEGTN